MGELYLFTVEWSSPVARQAHNLEVVSSNLTSATKFTAQASDSASRSDALITRTLTGLGGGKIIASGADASVGAQDSLPAFILHGGPYFGEDRALRLGEGRS